VTFKPAFFPWNRKKGMAFVWWIRTVASCSEEGKRNGTEALEEWLETFAEEREKRAFETVLFVRLMNLVLDNDGEYAVKAVADGFIRNWTKKGSVQRKVCECIMAGVMEVACNAEPKRCVITMCATVPRKYWNEELDRIVEAYAGEYEREERKKREAKWSLAVLEKLDDRRYVRDEVKEGEEAFAFEDFTKAPAAFFREVVDVVGGRKTGYALFGLPEEVRTELLEFCRERMANFIKEDMKWCGEVPRETAEAMRREMVRVARRMYNGGLSERVLEQMEQMEERKEG